MKKGQATMRLPLHVTAAIRLEYEAEGDLHTAGVRAVGEALRSAAVANVRDAFGVHDGSQDTAEADAVGSSLHAGVVDRVEGVEGFEREVGLEPLGEANGAAQTGIDVVRLVDIDGAHRQERNTIPATGAVQGAVGESDWVACCSEYAVLRSAGCVHGGAHGVGAGEGRDAGEFPIIEQELGDAVTALDRG